MFIVKIYEKYYFINDIYVIAPITILAHFIIVAIIKKNRVRKILQKEKLEREKIERKYKRLRLFYKVIGNHMAALKLRGGYSVYEASRDHLLNEEVIAEIFGDIAFVEHPYCEVGKGIQYIDNFSIIDLVWDHFSGKALPSGVIYITKEALYQFIRRQGPSRIVKNIPLPLITLPEYINIYFSDTHAIVRIFAIASGFLTTSISLSLSGVLTTILSGGLVANLKTLLTTTLIQVQTATFMTNLMTLLTKIKTINGLPSIFSLWIMLFTADPRVIDVKAVPISGPVASITRRIASQKEVVVVNLQPSRTIMRREISSTEVVSVDLNDMDTVDNRNRIDMSDSLNEGECIIPWIRPLEATSPKLKSVIDAESCIEQGKIADSIINSNLPSDYGDFVTLQDVSGLKKKEFGDKFEVVPDKGLEICSNNNLDSLKTTKTKPSKITKGKTVNFSEKFKDPNFISEEEKYNISPSTSSQQDPIRIKDKKL